MTPTSSRRPLAASVTALACVLGSTPSLAAESASDLFNANFCFACHSVSRSEVKKLGPYLVDIADKYRGQGTAAAALTRKVLEGGQGVWGDPKVSVMPPNKVTPQQAALLAQWVLQQK